MATVLGVGGIFFRSPDVDRLRAWYTRWLNMPLVVEETATFVAFRPAAMPKGGYTIWGPFPRETSYFGAREQAYMINLAVDDLDEALAQVVAGGAALVGEPIEHEAGRFGWFRDPDGNKVELWQPAEMPPFERG